VKGEYRIGVVIPARNEEHFIQQVVETLPDFVDLAIVINDGSTDETQSILEAMTPSEKVHFINLNGEGVGAAIDAGHQYLLQHWHDQLFISVQLMLAINTCFSIGMTSCSSASSWLVMGK